MEQEQQLEAPGYTEEFRQHCRESQSNQDLPPLKEWTMTLTYRIWCCGMFGALYGINYFTSDTGSEYVDRRVYFTQKQAEAVIPLLLKGREGQIKLKKLSGHAFHDELVDRANRERAAGIPDSKVGRSLFSL